MRDVEWLEDPDDEPASARRRRPVLLVAASLPWLLVVALLMLPGRLGDDGETTAPVSEADGPAAAQDEADDHADDDHVETGSGGRLVPEDDDGPIGPHREHRDTGVSDPYADLELTEIRGRWRVEPGIEEAASLAVVVARAWLTGLDPVLEVSGIDPPPSTGYAEHLVVEAVEHPARDAAVVTVVGVVLDGDDLDASVRRIAVPIVLRHDGARVSGDPWELPPPTLEPVELEHAPVEDADQLLAAADALRTAGLDEVTLVALHDTDGWPVVAEVKATDDADDTTTVWLRRHLDGFVVSGTTLAGSTPTTSDGTGIGADIGDDTVHDDGDDRGDDGHPDGDAQQETVP